MNHKKLRLIVLGSNGQLGRCFADLREEYDKKIEFLLYSRHNLDITNTQDLQRESSVWAKDESNYSATIIVNCAAYTAVDKAENEYELCMNTNVTAVEQIAHIATNKHWGVINFSSDYVFDGTDRLPYKEDNPTRPLGVYGKSKLLGEQRLALLAIQGRAITIRTQWLYSPYGNNFIKTMLRLSRTHSELRVVEDQIGCLTYAPSLAQAVLQIALLFVKEAKFRTPLLHLRNSGLCSWYDVAQVAIQLSGNGSSPQSPIKVHPISTEQYPTAAQRPPYSLLDTTLALTKYGIELEHWFIDLQVGVEQLKFSSPELFTFLS